MRGLWLRIPKDGEESLMEALGAAQEGENSFTPAQGDTQWAHLDTETQGFEQKETSWGIVKRLFLELHISMIKSKYYLWLKTFYSTGRKNWPEVVLPPRASAGSVLGMLQLVHKAASVK